MLVDNKLAFRVENIQPILSVKDMAASRAFYKGILGFEEADWGNDEFTSMGRDNKGAFYLCQGGQGQAGTWIWIGFDGDMATLYQALKAKGVVIRLPPTNYSWALEMQIEDPDGHVLRLGTDPNDNEPFADQ